MLICDFAETYKIYDYKALPPVLAATYASGLRKDSRIQMELRKDEVKYSFTEQLLILIIDRIRFLEWMCIGPGRCDVPVPKSIYEKIYKIEETKEVTAYETAEDFWKRRGEIINGRN